MKPIKLEIDCKDLPDDANEVLEKESARVGKDKSEVLKALILDAIGRLVEPNSQETQAEENDSIEINLK